MHIILDVIRYALVAVLIALVPWHWRRTYVIPKDMPKPDVPHRLFRVVQHSVFVIGSAVLVGLSSALLVNTVGAWCYCAIAIVGAFVLSTCAVTVVVKRERREQTQSSPDIETEEAEDL
jgi:hypothetical protein